MAEPDRDRFTDEVSLRNAVKGEGFVFPVVLKTRGCCEVYQLLNPDLNHHLPEDSLLMLEEQVNLSYVHVKILDLEKEEEVVKSKGQEYVDDYNQLVGEEFLIPVKFPNEVKVIHRPGKRRRYADVSEVLENLPRYVRVEIDTSATEPNTGASITVPRGTTLDVRKRVQGKDATFLECTGESEKRFWFKSGTIVNFTAIDDEKLYTLADIASQMPLPMVVKFEVPVSPDDVVVYDDTWASKVMLMSFGPIEIIGIKRKYSLVGWLRIKEMGVVLFRRVLVPISQWDKEMVRARNFGTTKERDIFCEKMFPCYINSSDHETKLYVIPVRSNGMTYIRGDRSLSVACDNDSSDDSEDYEKPMPSPGPAVPPRKPLSQSSKQHVENSADVQEEILLPKRNVRPDVWQRIVDKARLGFKFVHKELKHVYSVKEKACASSELEAGAETTKPKLPVKPKLVPDVPPVTKPLVIYSKSKRAKESKKDKRTHVPSPSPPPAVKPKPSPATKPKPRLPDPSVDDTDTGTPRRRPPPPPDIHSIPTREQNIASKEESINFQEDQSQPSANRPPMPLPEEDPDEEKHEYDYPLITEFVQRQLPNKPLYHKLTVAEVHTITRKNQTAKDFSAYSVNQVSECFSLCALQKLADTCRQERIDGGFLAAFELDLLKSEPFMLSEFEVKKVRQIIEDGWRPILDNS